MCDAYFFVMAQTKEDNKNIQSFVELEKAHLDIETDTNKIAKENKALLVAIDKKLDKLLSNGSKEKDLAKLWEGI